MKTRRAITTRLITTRPATPGVNVWKVWKRWGGSIMRCESGVPMNDYARMSHVERHYNRVRMGLCTPDKPSDVDLKTVLSGWDAYDGRLPGEEDFPTG